DKIEIIAQKCTELGISELVVVNSQRTVARIPAEKILTRLARWRKIAREAAEQCGRAVAPSVEGILQVGDLAELVPTVPLALLACESGDSPPLKAVLQASGHRLSPGDRDNVRASVEDKARRGPASDASTYHAKNAGGSEEAGPVMVIIGPEGGLSDEETGVLVEAGAVPISLGRRILRCETAAIAACAAVMYELEGEL
ncbi:MAG: RsmE family RNA methyltransferase, partial [Armatimonadota bacterium]